MENQFIPHLSDTRERVRIIAAISLGIAGGVFSMSMGAGAGGAYLMTLIAGTLLLILVGGRRGPFHVAVFGASIFGTLWISSPVPFTPSEVALHIGMSIIAPIVLALLATRILD